ncbi:hypothetical protein LA02_1526 [Francisella philomiragia]|uniref:hypothetical protein n=1 Tax=Francisella philomiragia TaxID=28110 RepID=UPI0005A55E20|nr:hypothetical protein [Francisella philomiragia]AJI57299.1 hypothetical protein LA02_1526 [Francisella philomiragia]
MKIYKYTQDKDYAIIKIAQSCQDATVTIEEAKSYNDQFLLYKELSKKQDVGGKNMRGNSNPIPGVYKDHLGRSHYIKIPNDPIEMFCETFHGVLVENYKKTGYLGSDPFFSSAEAIIVEYNGSKKLALKVTFLDNFSELFKDLGTGKENGKERSNFKEILDRDIYKKYVEGSTNKEYLTHAFAKCVFQSVALFGDYSLHSSNVALYGEGEYKRVAKIDGGASFRDFGKNSPRDILFPSEYDGIKYYKSFYKDYLNYYTRIPLLKEHLHYLAADYIYKINNTGEGSSFSKSLSNVIYESINYVKDIYNLVNEKPFEEKKISKHFGIDLSVDSKQLAKYMEIIIHNNIEGFRDLKVDKKCVIKGINFENRQFIKDQSGNITVTDSYLYDAQFTIIQIILSRGKDVKSKDGKESEKDKIKSILMENLKDPKPMATSDFLLYVYLLCASSNYLSFSSKTLDVLADGLSRLSGNAPARIYLGIPKSVRKISSSELKDYIKNRYKQVLEILKEKSYPKYLLLTNGNYKNW